MSDGYLIDVSGVVGGDATVTVPPGGPTADLVVDADTSPAMIFGFGTPGPPGPQGPPGGIAGVVASPADYGGVGDGLADDTQAVNGAIGSGFPVWFGNKRWRITTGLVLSLSADMVWLSDGATIILDSSVNLAAMVSITHNGFTWVVRGGVTLDANRRAFRGVYHNNNISTQAVIRTEHVTVQNVFRADTSFVAGDGVYIQGSFSLIQMIKPIIRNVTMAAGTGITGSIGVTGITIKSSSLTNYFRKVVIDHPLVENVYSEDVTYTSDQDGIRIMAAEDDGVTPVPYDSHFNIVGYTAHNCEGRALKSQAEFGFLTDTMIIRDRNRGLTAGVGTDIDFQVGGGQIKGVYCKYVNDAPNLVVSVSGPATATKIVPNPVIKDVRVVTTGSCPPTYGIQKGFRAETVSVTEISNVQFNGVQPACFLNINEVAGGHHDVFLSDVTCGPTLAGGQQGFIRVAGDNGTGHLFLSRLKNTGPNPIRLLGTTSALVLPGLYISAEDCVGFNNDGQRALDQGRNLEGPITRRVAIGAANQLVSGVERFAAQTVAAGSTWKLPPSFLTNYAGMILISVDGDAPAGQAFFAVSTATVTPIWAGSGWTAGTTSEPATGTYRIWTSSTGVTVSNRGAVSHTFTAFMFG